MPHDCPTGKSLLIFRNRVKAWSQKHFPFAVGQISASTSAVPAREEGRIAIVTDVGHGMRWTRQRRARKAFAGRDEPRERRRRDRRKALKRTVKPCGPDTRCWCQVRGGNFRPTGREALSIC